MLVYECVVGVSCACSVFSFSLLFFWQCYTTTERQQPQHPKAKCFSKKIHINIWGLHEMPTKKSFCFGCVCGGGGGGVWILFLLPLPRVLVRQ